MKPIPHAHDKVRAVSPPVVTGSVLGWPAWLRVLSVLPVVAVLWLALGWAGGWPW